MKGRVTTVVDWVPLALVVLVPVVVAVLVVVLGVDVWAAAKAPSTACQSSNRSIAEDIVV
jgi:hypothetical protein